MPRLAPLPREELTDLGDILRASESRMGFVPNSQLIMARRPGILRAFAQLVAAINGPSSTISAQLRNMVSQMASWAGASGNRGGTVSGVTKWNPRFRVLGADVASV